MSKTVTFRIELPKPRNRHAFAARLKHVGCHRRSTGAMRQASKRNLEAEMAASTHPPPAC